MLGSAQKRSSGELAWLCPIHDDHTPSLLVNPKKNAFFCGPCGEGGNAWQFAAFLARVSPNDKRAVTAWLKDKGLLENGNQARKVDAEYIYLDRDGCAVMLVRRYSPKSFRQFRFEAGQWVPGLKDQDGRLVVDLVPYHLPELLSAEVVFVVEGEKDADRLAELGLTATCNPMGAGKWHEEYSRWFEGKKVVVLADNDQAGRAHARAVARSLLPIAHAVKVVELPGLPEKGDVSDWLQQGHTLDELKAAVKATPELSAEDLEDSEEKASADVCAGPLITLERQWPAPLAPEAFQGITGELTRMIEPHTEADVSALLVQFLVSFGNAAGRGPHWTVESTRHGLNLFAVTVGESSKARKGTSWDRIRYILSRADPDWAESRITGGLSSGEGLIWSVRDPIEETKPVKKAGRHTGDYETVITDQGVEDKRLLLIEDEFAGVLRVLEREGNKLSAIVRRAFDSGDLNTLVKSCSTRATGAHISVIGHITRDELLTYLSQTERGNGFGNRFLWVCVRRSKYLPAGGRLQDVDLEPIINRVRQALEFAKVGGEIRRDAQAEADWARVYPALSEGKPGLLGSMTARAEALTMRLAAIYAALDCSREIRREHLRAALAVWEYCEASAKFIFGDSLGDPTADEILKAVRKAGETGLTQTELSHYFARHKSANEIGRALTALVERDLVTWKKEETGGRPIVKWYYKSAK
ncbi:MAG TPA: DUF3987 domain-containing protein [Acidobacteriota bacterium]|nr:DUF3987 domain-containing protein [Acidobacteriota bacterium]